MNATAWTAGASLFLFCLTMAFGNAAGSHAAPNDTEAWKREVLAWREKYVAELKKPDGWLSLAGLEWLEPGQTSFGSAPDNKIHLAGAPEHLGILELKDNTVRLLPPSGGFSKNFMVADSPAHEQILRVDPDNDVHAVHMTIGTLNFYVI